MSSLRRPPPLRAPLRMHVRYFQAMTTMLFARHVGHAIVHVITGGLYIVLAFVVLGSLSVIASFRI